MILKAVPYTAKDMYKNTNYFEKPQKRFNIYVTALP